VESEKVRHQGISLSFIRSLKDSLSDDSPEMADSRLSRNPLEKAFSLQPQNHRFHAP
jgi:hypothetical protein